MMLTYRIRTLFFAVKYWQQHATRHLCDISNANWYNKTQKKFAKIHVSVQKGDPGKPTGFLGRRRSHVMLKVIFAENYRKHGETSTMEQVAGRYSNFFLGA